MAKKVAYQILGKHVPKDAFKNLPGLTRRVWNKFEKGKQRPKAIAAELYGTRAGRVTQRQLKRVETMIYDAYFARNAARGGKLYARGEVRPRLEDVSQANFERMDRRAEAATHSGRVSFLVPELPWQSKRK